MQDQYIKIDSDGNKYYYSDKQMLTRHRTDGPAIELRDGSNFWFVGGKRHRLDGPAVESSDGTKDWYVDGMNLTKSRFNELTRPRKSCSGQTVVVDGVTYKLLKVPSSF